MSIKSWAGNLKSKRRARARAAILFVILLAGGIGSWFYFGDDTEPEPDPANGPLAGEMTFLPDSVTDIAVYQYDIARSCPAVEELRTCGGDPERMSFSQEPAPNGVEAVRSVVVSKPFPMTIRTMRKAISPKIFFGPYVWEHVTKSKESGITIYLDGSRCYWFVGRRVAIADISDLRKMWTSAPRTPFTGAMLSALQSADFSKPELHLRAFDPPEGGEYAYAEGTKSEFSADFHRALTNAISPVTILSELDYQSPTAVRVHVICESTAAANRVAREFRKADTAKRLGPLRNCVVKVAESTVTLETAIKPCDIGNLPDLVTE